MGTHLLHTMLFLILGFFPGLKTLQYCWLSYDVDRLLSLGLCQKPKSHDRQMILRFWSICKHIFRYCMLNFIVKNGILFTSPLLVNDKTNSKTNKQRQTSNTCIWCIWYMPSRKQWIISFYRIPPPPQKASIKHVEKCNNLSAICTIYVLFKKNRIITTFDWQFQFQYIKDMNIVWFYIYSLQGVEMVCIFSK